MNRIDYIPTTLYTIPNFLSQTTCQHLIQQSERIGYEKAKLDTGKVVPEVRNNERILHNDAQLAEKFWQLLYPQLTVDDAKFKAIDLNEMFRFYKYRPSHRFLGHQDGSYERNNREFSRFTFMVYLNDDYQGEEIKFQEHTIPPKTEMVLILLHKLYHEGCEVLDGIQYVLRTDIMYRKTKLFYKEVL